MTSVPAAKGEGLWRPRDRGVCIYNCQDEDYIRISIRYILKRLENLEEITMPRTELSPKVTPFQKMWVPLSCKSQSENTILCVLFTSFKTRILQKQGTRIITVPQEAGKDPQHWMCCSLRTHVTGIINKTRGISFLQANSQPPTWPGVFSSPMLT